VLGTFRFFVWKDNCHISIDVIYLDLGDFVKIIGKMIVK